MEKWTRLNVTYVTPPAFQFHRISEVKEGGNKMRNRVLVKKKFILDMNKMIKIYKIDSGPLYFDSRVAFAARVCVGKKAGIL